MIKSVIDLEDSATSLATFSAASMTSFVDESELDVEVES